MSHEHTYPFIESDELQPLMFVFVSNGLQPTIKVVQYTHTEDKEGQKVYNLGLGDYDVSPNTIIDDVNTNNGDVYKVLNTVLNTIPLFFQTNPNDWLIVRGSDSTADFVENCRETCTKNCTDVCRNYNRRITLYCNYVNKHYSQLSSEYQIFGGIENENKQRVFEVYVPHKKYIAVLLKKIKS